MQQLGIKTDNSYPTPAIPFQCIHIQNYKRTAWQRWLTLSYVDSILVYRQSKDRAKVVQELQEESQINPVHISGNG